MGSLPMHIRNLCCNSEGPLTGHGQQWQHSEPGATAVAVLLMQVYNADSRSAELMQANAADISPDIFCKHY
jgi:low affinity Fe/Cu permease